MIERKQPNWAHAFEVARAQNDIDHRLTKPKHPWANGQVERMNRTIKDATVKRFHYETHNQLRSHLADFVSAYNYAKQLKTLEGLAPYEYICKAWTKEAQRFAFNPLQQVPGLNTRACLVFGGTVSASPPRALRCDHRELRRAACSKALMCHELPRSSAVPYPGVPVEA
jgi:hypothetical protein